jgi:hypothetical protein
MDRLSAVEEALRRHLDLPDDLERSELRREAQDALQLANQGISRDALQAHLALMLVHRMGQPYNAVDCEHAAAAIFEIAYAPKP